jgi:hypothetical protein
MQLRVYVVYSGRRPNMLKMISKDWIPLSETQTHSNSEWKSICDIVPGDCFLGEYSDGGAHYSFAPPMNGIVVSIDREKIWILTAAQRYVKQIYIPSDYLLLVMKE